ncbi:hypothetical protein PR001_g20678, partial [Phytophthora rubi]
MEKLMDHYGNVTAERKLRTPGSKVRAAARLVAASELEHGELRLASSKRRPAAWWRRPSSGTAVAQQAASRLVAASELAHGMLRLPGSK